VGLSYHHVPYALRWLSGSPLLQLLNNSTDFQANSCESYITGEHFNAVSCNFLIRNKTWRAQEFLREKLY
jgi:hypothetical protein